MLLPLPTLFSKSNIKSLGNPDLKIVGPKLLLPWQTIQDFSLQSNMLFLHYFSSPSDLLSENKKTFKLKVTREDRNYAHSIASGRHVRDFLLDLLFPLIDLWHRRSLPTPLQVGSRVRKEQHHSGKIHEPQEKEHPRDFHKVNLLYLLHESDRAVIFPMDTTNTTY